MHYRSDEFTLGVDALITRLGQQASRTGRPHSLRWKLAHLADLIDNHGFPPPLPFAGNTAPCAQSRWLAAAVDAWLGDFMPPGASDAMEAAARREADRDLDANAVAVAAQMAARQLRVVDGGRRA